MENFSSKLAGTIKEREKCFYKWSMYEYSGLGGKSRGEAM